LQFLPCPSNYPILIILIPSSSLSPLLPSLPQLPKQENRTHRNTLNIPPPAKLGPKSRQLPRLILLNIQQLMRARIPQRRVARIFCRPVHGRWVRRPMQECAAVG
jgi:hypothetical protein